MGLLSSLKREAKTVPILIGTKKWTRSISNESRELLPDDLEQAVDKYHNNIAFIFEGRTTRYGELDAMANRIAHWALSQGLKTGDTVALFMENCPAYVAMWYGLSKVGVIPALVNSNLTGEALVHSIRIVEPSLIITGSEQDEAMRSLAMAPVNTPVFSRSAASRWMSV